MRQEVLDKMNDLISYAKDAGADECDVISSKGESLSLSAQNGAIDKFNVAGSSSIGIRVIKDNKVGLSYTESMDVDALKFAAKKAVENSVCVGESPFESIKLENKQNLKEKKINNPTSLEEKKKFTLALEADVKKRDSRIQTVPYNGLSERTVEKYYLNSKNTHTFQNDHYYSCYTSALINDGKKSSMNYHSSIAKTFNDLDKNNCVDQSYQHALNWLDATSVETGRYNVIFTPDSFEELFGCFGGVFSGKAAMEKNNPFEEKVGKIVGHKELIITDSPRFKEAFSEYYFDDEGFDQEDLCLLDKGELKTFYHNTKTASFFNLNTTARAARGSKSALGVSGTNIVIHSGSTEESNLLKDKYIEIHSMQGLHSGAKFMSGDFSFAASGYLKENGQVLRPIKGITVAGNFYNMLKNIAQIGNIQHGSTHRSFFTPLIKFSDMSVAG